MKVLVATGLYPPDIGGPATYSKFLVDELPKRGIEVVLLAFSEVRRYPPLIRYIIFAWKTFMRGRDVAVIYAQDTVSVGVPAMLANLFLWKKFFVRVPGDHAWEQGTRRFGLTMPLEKMPRWSWRWHPTLMVMRLAEFLTVRAADALIVPSKYMAKVVRTWPVDAKKVHLIYNGVEEFSGTGLKPVIRGLLKFDGKLVLSAGRLVPWKGFGALLELLPALKKTFPELKLLIIGTGSDMHVLEQKAAELGVEGDVIFAGEVERDVLIRYIRASDVFVLNSRYEGLSHQILEVMSVGVPVITTNVGGNPEVIEDGKNGFLVKPNDTQMLIKRITTLLTDTALRAQMVQSARRTVKRFSNETMVDETAALIRKLCAS